MVQAIDQSTVVNPVYTEGDPANSRLEKEARQEQLVKNLFTRVEDLGDRLNQVIGQLGGTPGDDYDALVAGEFILTAKEMSNTSFASAATHYIKLFIPYEKSISSFKFRHSSGVPSAMRVDIGLYDSSGDILVQGYTEDTATGFISIPVTSTAITPGYYWIGTSFVRTVSTNPLFYALDLIYLEFMRSAGFAGLVTGSTQPLPNAVPIADFESNITSMIGVLIS